MRRPRVVLPFLAVLALAGHAASRLADDPESAQAADLATEQSEEQQSQPPAAAGEPVGAGPADAGTALVELEPGAAMTRRAPPLDSLTPLPAKADLVARARPGPDGRITVQTPAGTRTLTLDAALQRQLTQLLEYNNTPHAAVVVMEPRTGRVLAMAEHSEAQPGMRGLALRAAYPAASIFKMVTGSALLKKGVSTDTEECFHGGKRRLKLALLQDSARDSSCYSLAEAMGKSANVVFAKLTSKHLSATDLLHEAELFGFNRPLRFELPVDVSPAAIPTAGLPLAETAAGFGDVYMSPLHGALVVAAVANGGRWQDATLFEPDVPGAGEVVRASLPAGAPGAQLAGEEGTGAPQVMTAAQAEAMTDMLEATVTSGTARRVFRERGYRVEGAVGKTGTLADRTPFRDYSWFVGFAPRDNPKVVVSAVVVNGLVWRIRAPYVGREAMRLALKRLEAGQRLEAAVPAASRAGRRAPVPTPRAQ